MAQPQQQAQRGKRRDSWLVQYLWPLASVLVPLIMFGLVAWQGYKDALHETEQEVLRSTEIFQGHALNVFQAHELAAERVNERLRGMSWDEIGQSKALHEYLKKITADLPPIQAIWLADATGRIRNASQVLPAAPVSVADRDYFKALRERAGGTAVGELVQARVMKGWNFNTARRRGNAGDAFDGVIIVTIFANYFSDFWSQGVTPGRNTVVLVRGDGRILARLPVIDPMPPSVATNSPLLQQLRNADQGHFRAVSAIDGVDRLLGFRRLPRYDAILVYGVDVRGALAGWREHLLLYGALFGAAAVALLLFSFLAQQAARQAEMRAQTKLLEEKVRERTAELADSEARFRKIASDRSVQLVMNERASYSYARSLIEASLDPLVTIDADGRITDVNEGSIKVTGVCREDLIGTDFSNYFTEPDRAREGYQQVFAKGFVTDYPLTIRHKDGSLTDVLYNASVYKDPQGTVLGVFAAARDVTERKRLEKEREQYFRFFTLTTDAMCIADPFGCFKQVNPAFSRLTGYTESELVSKPFLDFVLPEDRDRTADEMKLQVEVRASLQFENRYVCKDGSVIVLSWNAYFDKSDGVTYATARDVSALKRAEAEIRAMNTQLESRVRERTAQLEAANKELEAFAYSVSHDLRVPLRAVDGFSSMLEKEFRGALGEEGRRLIGVIRDSTRKMGRLIDDILAFSRMGRKELTRESVDMGMLVRSAFDELAAAREGRDVQLSVGELPRASGARAMLKQVWVNLIGNAIKFTRARSSARIEVGAGQGAGVEADQNVYFVRDNGVGFDMQYAHKLFGVFQRLHGVDEFEGTGIGLAIVQRIVARHGGRAWAEGKVNGGATIFFSLPKAESTAAAGCPPANAPLEAKA